MVRNTMVSGMGGMVLRHGHGERQFSMRSAYFLACNCSSVDSSFSESLRFFVCPPTPFCISIDSHVLTPGLCRLDIGVFLKRWDS